MKRSYFFLAALLSLVALGVNCKNTSNLPQNVNASNGINREGEFLNPDATPLIYEPPAPKKPGKGEFFSHTEHGVDLPDQKRKADMKFKGNPITCADCHNGECNPKKGSVDINRPGHDSCAGNRTGGCHPEFMSNQKVCSSCHTRAPALRPYGSAQIVNVLDYGFDYDHSSHLGTKSQPSKRNKKEATCDTCHVEDKQGKNQGQAGHTQCGQCHCDADAKVKMNSCVSCHTGTDSARSAHAYLDYRPHAQAFMHKDHRVDDKGANVACKSCHVGVGESDTLLEVAVPPMLGCLQSCHDGTHKDSAGKPIFDGWVKCSECHEAGAPKGKPAKKKKK
jgi:hypothetical protein